MSSETDLQSLLGIEDDSASNGRRGQDHHGGHRQGGAQDRAHRLYGKHNRKNQPQQDRFRSERAPNERMPEEQTLPEHNPQGKMYDDISRLKLSMQTKNEQPSPQKGDDNSIFGLSGSRYNK